MLKFDNVSFQYDVEDFSIIDHLSFDVQDGEFVSVIGASGCGKSTIFRLVNKLLLPASGEILVDGESIEKKRNYCGYMPQQDLLFPWRTVRENLLLPMEIRSGYSKMEMREKADAALESVGLKDWGDKMPKELSGGMRQRVMIAMAISCNPELIIADEPTTALDVTIQAQILQLLKELRAKYHLTIVMITHDLGVVANIADRVAVMYAGDIVEIGTADEIYYDPRHPYTWALLSSMPQMGIKGEDLFNIVGTPPNLFAEIRGDAFAPRNPQALKIDYVKRPPYFEVSPTHKAKTWLLDPRAPHIEPPAAVKKLQKEGL